MSHIFTNASEQVRNSFISSMNDTPSTRSIASSLTPPNLSSYSFSPAHLHPHFTSSQVRPNLGSCSSRRVTHAGRGGLCRLELYSPSSPQKWGKRVEIFPRIRETWGVTSPFILILEVARECSFVSKYKQNKWCIRLWFDELELWEKGWGSLVLEVCGREKQG